MRPTLLLWIVSLALVLGSTLGGCLFTPTCDCGREYERDPGSPDGRALGLDVGHSPELHCYCACDGEGPELRFDPSRDCAIYEVACANGHGETGIYECSGGVR